uniref:Helicase protein MOM1 n=1 Tax=Zea mays TaxID=4577 RepID=A0A804PEL8_MAIZE
MVQSIRNIEHAKGDIIANPSMVPGSATSLVVINAENDSTVAADPDHLESHILASVTTLQHPTSEEPSDTLHAMAVQDLQTEMQTTCPTLGAQHQKVCPDDSSKMNHEPDTTTGMLQEGTTSDHLDDSSTGVKEKNIDTVIADPLNSENQSYIAMPEAWVAEIQSDQSSMPAQHSTSLPTQRKLPVLGHPPEEANPSSNLDTEAAQKPDIQPSSSTLDADSSETRHQPETTTVLSQVGSKNHDVGTFHAQKAQSDSPILAAPQSTAMLSLPLEAGTPANVSSTSSLQSNGVSSRHTPAVSESSGMLGTQPEQDLHHDLGPSMSLLGVPLQRMLPDDRSQTVCQPDRGTDLSGKGETEYLACTTSDLSTLPLSGEAETENGQASMPAQEITSPHAQHSLALATSQHPVGDLQPPTLILSEETERAGLLCTSASQDLQLSMITQEDVPLERTDLSGMPVTQSTTVLQSVEPSCDPHAEEAGTWGMLSAPDLQSRMQSSSQLQDQIAEAEGAGIFGTIPAQNLQPETWSSTSAQHISPLRTHPDERIQIGLQPNTTPVPELLGQLSTLTPAGLLSSNEPLMNELEKLKYCNAVLCKNHEQKKSQLQTECNQEIEKVKEKYELLRQEEDSVYHRLTTDLNRIYTKVLVNQSLAEFFKASLVQERSARPTIWQAPQSSQHAPCGTTAAQATLLPVASSLATRPTVLMSYHTTGPHLPPSQVARPPASGAIQLQPVLPGNHSRAAPSPVGSMHPRHGIYRAVGAQSRGPAPHLQQLRMPAPFAMVHRDGQHPPSIMNPGVIPSRQSVHGNFESSASGNALAGISFASMAPSSGHQAMSSTSDSHPVFPASSLLPGSGPGSMTNFVRSSTRIPVVMASEQAPRLNPYVHHIGGGPLNAAPAGIQQARAHIGRTPQAASDQSQDVLHRLLLQLPEVMAPSLAQPTASSSHPAPMAARQQAGLLNPAPDNVACPLNAVAGVGRPGARIGSQSYQVSASLLEWEATLRVGLIRGHQGTYPLGQGCSDLAGGPPGTSAAQGCGSGASREVVCLSDDEE